MTAFLQQLRERKMFQWAVAYLAGAWAVLQVLQFMSSTYGWAPVLLRVVPVVIAGGLLLILVLSWYHGHVGRQRFHPVELLLLALIVLATTASAIIIGNKPPTDAASDSVAAAANTDPKSVAVLPFANLSGGDESTYFASGIHDELLTQLAQLGDLDVISRTSVLAYKNTTKPLRQIARELGVAAVLEGSVQKAGNRIRVQAQLIDGRTDRHLWAERYDRDLTDVFAIQSEIAQRIASALQVALTTSEKSGLEKAPTQNMDAHDAYLRGRQYQTLPSARPDNLEAAIEMYERAIQLDPKYAPAHAWLSFTTGQYRWFGYDASDERIAKQKAEAETALRLDPQLAEAHLAMGCYYYWARRDYTNALVELNKALALAPGNTDVLNFVGAVNRRMGKFSEALTYFEKVVKLDPRNPDNFADGLAQTYQLVRRYDDARAAYRKARALAPGVYDLKSELGWFDVLTTGQIDTLRTFLQSPNLPARSYENPEFDRFRVNFYSRDFAGALRAAQRMPDIVQNQERYFPRALVMGWAYQWLNRPEAKAAFDSARVMLAADTHKYPNDARIVVALAYAYAGLGRKADAVREAARARALLPPTLDAFNAPRVTQASAEVLVQVGAQDEAIALIGKLLKEPGYLTVFDLRLNPMYDPVRSDPRFQKLSH